MKRFFSRKLAALLVALVMVLALTTPASLAAAACRVSFSDPSVTVGNNVTINVSVSGSVAGATIRMNYDQSYLQYVSGNLGYGSGGGGMVVLDNENKSAGNMSFSMTFKALKTGSTTVTCASYDIVDGNGDPMAVTMGQSAVTINAAPTASSNNNLGSLSISPGTLSPGFSAGTTSYKAWVSNSTTSVAVYAKTQDGKAKMVYWGNSDFKVGDNTVTVQVTAENGAKKYYTITVNRAAGSTGGNTGGNTDTKPDNTPVPTPTQPPRVTATLSDDTKLAIAASLPEGVSVPAGFEESKLEVEGQSILTAVHKEGDLTVVYLEGDENHPAGFYFYDQKTGEAQPMTQVDMAASKLTLVDLPTDEEEKLPEGYVSTLMELGGQQHTLLVPDGVKEPNHYIVCALDEKGVMGLYLYDVEQKTFQRYQFLELPQEEPVEEEEPVETGFVFNLFGREFQTNWSDTVVSYLLIGLGALSVVLLVVVIVLAVFLVKSRKALRLNRMRQDGERQRRIVEGSSLTVDEILAENRLEQEQDEES